MMADHKSASLVSSAMVELKAELFRKQEEFKRQKLTESSFVKGRKSEKTGKRSIWSAQNSGVLARAQKDLEETAEDEDVLAKSRRILEEKSRLYEQIASSSEIPEEDGSEGFLVDFQKKAIDSIVEEREAKRRKEEEEKEEEEEKLALSAEIPEPSDPEEKWVTFTDSLGRSRCCMKKDLKHLMQKDQELAKKQSKGTSTDTDKASQSRLPDLMSSDMNRELMRQKWEQEEQEMLERGQKDVHYANVQFDEIRGHGVGYYQFSKDHEKREEEMENLKKMREQTVNERTRKDMIKEKRKSMMEARLAKVRQRRKLKEGPQKEEGKAEDVEEVIGPKLEEAMPESSEEEKKVAEKERQEHVREWDKGKDPRQKLWSHKDYLERLRGERDSEFAPPSSYFEKPKAGLTRADKIRMNRLKKSVSNCNSEFAPPDSYSESPQLSTEKTTSLLGTPADSEDIQMKCIAQVNKSVPQKVENTSFDSSAVNVASIPMPPDVSHSASDVQSTCNSPSISSIGVGEGQPDDAQSWYGGGVPQPQPFEQHLAYMQQQHTQYIPQQHYGLSHIPQTQYQQQQHNHQQNVLHNMYTLPPAPTPQQECAVQQTAVQQPDPQPQHFQSYPMPGTQSDGTAGLVNHLPPSTSSFTSSYQPAPGACDTQPKKPMVPKSAIMDMRFMQSNVSQEDFQTGGDLAPPLVSAKPYEPGSFTAAKFSHKEDNEDSVAGSRDKQQYSGGPMLYTSEQRQQQLAEKESEEVEEKVQDFLTSIRNVS